MNKDYVIIHGQLYAVPSKSNELKHWKYVKREKVNGKWRYYYDDSELKKAKSAEKEARTEMGKAAVYSDKAKDEYDDAVNNARNFMNGDTSKVKDVTKQMSINSDLVKSAKSNYTNAESYHKEAVAAYDKAYSKLRKTKVKHVVVGTIAKGVAAVGNFFSKLFSKKK